MKSLITITMALTLCLLSSIYAEAQETHHDTQTSVEQLQNLKEKIIQEEKDALKAEIENINARLESENITGAESENLKQEAAEKHALNIENRIAIVENQVELLKRNGDDTIKKGGTRIVLGLGQEDIDDDVIFGIKFQQKDPDKIKNVVYDRRTTSALVFAGGLNNAIIEEESLSDSPYSTGKSGFMELGWSWKTRVFKNSNFLRIKYGMSLQWNRLELKDNLYFVDNGDMTILEESLINLNKAELRVTNLIVPVHFEFGPSKKIEKEDYFRYNTTNQFKIGLGGYAGFNIGTQQKLKYKEDGERVKDKIKRDYNTTDFVYGVSGYIGFDFVSLYAKYDLNPLFTNQTKKQNLVSIGLRIDMD